MKIVFLLIVSIFIFGCSQDNTLNARRLLFCSASSPSSFNPQLSTTTSALKSVSLQIYDRLFEFNQDTLRLEGALAKDWDYDPKTLRYTITLRKNIHFHTTPWFQPTRTLEAKDVVFSFERFMKTNHPYHFISGGQYPMITSAHLPQIIRDIRATSPHEVIFELNQPNSAFLSALASHYAVILSEEYGQNLLKQHTPEKIDRYPVGTGPFSLLAFKPDNFIRYQKHPKYWRQQVVMEQIIFDITPQVSTRLAMLATGECDVMAYPSASQIPAIEKNQELKLLSQEVMNIAYLALNTRNKTLNNLKVRQAIAMAIDKEKIFKIIYFNQGRIAHNILPPLSWAYHFNLGRYPYDPQKAKAILEKIDPDFDYFLNLWIQPQAQDYNPDTIKTAQLIQSDLAQIGIHVEIKQYPWLVMQPLLKLGQHDMLLFGWSSNDLDPDSFLRQLFSCTAVRNGYNFSRWCSRQLDATLNYALTNNKLSERIVLYKNVQETLHQEVPIIPLNHAPYLLAYRQGIKGLKLSPLGDIEFYQITEK